MIQPIPPTDLPPTARRASPTAPEGFGAALDSATAGLAEPGTPRPGQAGAAPTASAVQHGDPAPGAPVPEATATPPAVALHDGVPLPAPACPARPGAAVPEGAALASAPAPLPAQDDGAPPAQPVPLMAAPSLSQPAPPLQDVPGAEGEAEAAEPGEEAPPVAEAAIPPAQPLPLPAPPPARPPGEALEAAQGGPRDSTGRADATSNATPPEADPAAPEAANRLDADDRPDPAQAADARPVAAPAAAERPAASAAASTTPTAAPAAQPPAAMPPPARFYAMAGAMPGTMPGATAPTQQLAPILAAQATQRGGLSRLMVTLRPAELGAVEIAVESMADGPARISILAERPETLQMLQRDRLGLEQALQRAGIDQAPDALTLGLSDPGNNSAAGQAPDRREGRDAPRNTWRQGAAGQDAAPLQPLPPPRALRGLLDLAL